MIEKKQRSGSFLSVLMLLLILGILLTLGYCLFYQPELLGFPPEEAEKKSVFINGKTVDLKTVAPELMNVRLYFSNANSETLSTEDRGIPKCSSVQNYAREILKQLIKGPNNKDLYRTIPPTTTVRAIYLYGTTLVIDFSKDIVTQHNGGVSSELLTIYSIVNTLAELPAVDGKAVKNIQILVNGAVLKSLVGHINIEKPIAPESKFVSSI